MSIWQARLSICGRRWPRRCQKIPQLAALQPYAQYFSLASPVLLMIVLLVLALLRALVSGDAYFMLNL